MKFLSVLILLCFFLFLSCSQEERVIDQSNPNWKTLISTADVNNSVKLIEQPTGKIIQEDIFLEANGELLGSKVKKMTEFQKKIFLFLPEIYKIEIVDKDNFKRLSTLDFSSEKKSPTGICFANATTAYIAFGNDSTVDVLDLTNFKIARTIKVGIEPFSIVNSGNQIFVANKLDNTLSVIDSRTNEVTHTINVPQVPLFLDVSTDGARVVLISSGTGKYDAAETKSPAYITLIDVATKQILKSKELGRTGINPIEQIPTALASTVSNSGFVTTNEFLIRINTLNGDEITNLGKGNHLTLSYNYKRDELIIIRQTTKGIEGITANSLTGKQIQKLFIPENFIAILPYQ
jgi:YVTN family beta-propeller protein